MPAAAGASFTPEITGMSGTWVGARGETADDMGAPYLDNNRWSWPDLFRPSTPSGPVDEVSRRGCPGQAHGCPVRFLWTGCMTWILLCFERFAHVRDTEGGPRHAASE